MNIVRTITRLPLVAVSGLAALTLVSGASAVPNPQGEYVPTALDPSMASIATAFVHSALDPVMSAIATAEAPTPGPRAEVATEPTAQAASEPTSEPSAAPTAEAVAPAPAPAPTAEAVAPAPAPAPAQAGPDWTLDIQGYCDNPYCAQSAVDSYGMSYVDYTTGFRTFAGHMEGEAGVILSMSDGDTVQINGPHGGLYRIDYSTTVPKTATTDDVAPGLALQTCLPGDSMMVRYLTQIG